MEAKYKRKVLLTQDPEATRSFIKHCKSVIKKQGDDAKTRGFREQNDIHRRRMLLREIEREVVEPHTSARRLFISYTRTGAHIANQALEIAKSRGIEVVFGLSHILDDEVREQILRDGSRVRPIIKENITSCDMFLGIWTADFEGQEIGGRDLNNNIIPNTAGCIPGVWMPLEFGIAMAADLSFEIMLEIGTHRSVYEKALGDWRGRPFKSSDFRPVLIEAITELDQKYFAKHGGGHHFL